MPVTGMRETFDISLNQLNILRQEESAKGSAINNIASTIRFSGAADPVLLCETVKNVIRTDASLRTMITEENGRAMQYHADFVVPEIPVLDFSASDEAYYLKWAESRAKESIYALDAPLFRFFVCILGEKTLCLFSCTHHIISDGWGHLALCNRIAAAYEDAIAGGEGALSDTFDYAAYVEDEQNYLSSEKYARDKEYWQKVLSDSFDAVSLKSLRGASVSNVGARTTLAFPVTLNNAIYAYCMENAISPVGVYYAALAACLRRGGCADRISIGVPVFNRNNFRFKNTTGMFVSTLPFICEADDTLSLNAFCELFQNHWTETLRHQRFPFDEMLHLAGEEEKLFHLMLSYQSSKIADLPDTTVKISGQWHYCGYQNEQLCIQMTDFDGKNEYSVNYDWQVQLFTEKEISGLHSHICRILFAALENPERPLCDIVLADSAEKERVLYTYNDDAGVFPAFVPPYELFCKCVGKRPSAVAVICGKQRISYAELAELGQKAAAAVGGAGKLCAILLPKSAWTYAAMMGVLQAGSAFCSISTDQPAERIHSILTSSGADILLTDAAHIAAFGADVPLCLDVNTLQDKTAAVAAVREDTLAYTVYTSGTTGVPKGVEIGCAAFSNLCQAMSGIYGDGAILSLCNTGFDAFILESAAAMCCGKTAVIAGEDEKDNPAAIASLIEKTGIRFMALTPSRMQAFLHSEVFRRAAGQLKTIICGGEAFPSDLLRSLKKYTEAAIYNQYGPSEATVAVSMACLNNTDRITAGKPMPGCRLYVLDSCMHPLPENFVGELYIGGICVGKGYRNAPELTEKSFLRSPFIPGERLYKTGDCAMWTSDGEVVILGRKDSQVKLRGLRVEPQEISSSIARFPGVRGAAAKAAEWNGQVALFGYYVADTELSETDILAFCADFLPRYMLPARIMRIDAVPLTVNGKVDEKKLPVPVESEAAVLPRTRSQMRLLSVFRDTLHNESVHAGSDYFLSGGNSLSAMDTLAAIEQEFGVRLPASVLYACRTVVQLDTYLSEHTEGGLSAEKLTKAPQADTYPASGTQKSIYFASQLENSGKAYLMPCAFVLPDSVGEETLRTALSRLAADDPLFRSSFRLQDGEIVACVADSADISFENYGEISFVDAKEKILAPFDLAKAPLMRAAVAQVDGKRLLFLCVHHILCDGLSVPVIVERLDRFCRGEEAPEHATFFDCCYYAEKVLGAQIPAQLDYWESRLQGCPEYTDLSPDMPRPKTFDGKGDTVEVLLPPAVTEAVQQLQKQYGVTEYAVFAGALGLLFSRLSGQESVVLGTPVSGRRVTGFASVVGPLMRTMPLRLSVNAKLCDYLAAVAADSAEMMDMSDCDIADIVARAGVSHTTERNPLYQILFQMRPVDTEAFCLGGERMEYLPISTGTAKLDLDMEAAYTPEGYVLHMQYASSVYDAKTVQTWAELTGRILCAFSAANPSCNVRSLEIPEEQAPAVYDLPPYLSIQTEIHRAAQKTPDSVAVIWHNQELSYAELERKAMSVAGQLREAGIQPGDAVGLVCSRTPDLFAALWGILRCGAVYVPFLADYPAERASYMMETVQARCVLCDASSAACAKKTGKPVTVIDANAPADAALTETAPEAPMYVLFTSGSTGMPKGVQLPQRALSNLLAEERAAFAGIKGSVLCTTNCTFDIFITESLLALAQGFPVVLADETEMTHPWLLADLIARYDVRISQYTPSRLEMNLRNDAFAAAQEKMEITILVGENVPASLVKDFYRCSHGRLLNWYGPTEAAVYVTKEVLGPRDAVTVGKPMGNCRIYVLDSDGKPVLPGEKGEAYLAGICLADGYVGKPELTAKAFLPDPFCPGERMYRTGDVFRLRSDGRYECFGRRDGQIKINGIRVEPEEIEQVLMASGAKKAVVFASKNPDGSSFLQAAVVPASLHIPQLRKEAARRLPPALIPAKILGMDGIPMNSSGKADMPKLKKMLEEGVEQTSADVALPEYTEAEKKLLPYWQEILGSRMIVPDVSFFAMGGSSLSALNIISAYYNAGISMNLESFYAHPTLREQATFLFGNTEQSAASLQGERQAIPHGKRPKVREEKDILLTGATGFLGAHLVKELLDKRQGQIICLMRDGSRERLFRYLRFYFGEEFPETSRIEVVCGDILEKNLGLSEETQKDLASRVTLLIHSAADVRHYASDDLLYRTNCEGTANVAEFALRNGMELAHISTASICGELVEDQPERDWVFTEEDFDIGQNRTNRYIHGKLEAERRVLDAMERGLSARIFRIGRLIGRYSDGKFQYNKEKNAFWRVMQGFYALGAIPESIGNVPLELLPVDICAAEITALLHATSHVYHVVQPQPLPIRELIPGFSKPVSVVSDAEFEKLLRSASENSSDWLGSIVDFTHMISEPVHIFLSSEKTRMLLHLAHFRIPEGLGHALDEI